MKKRIPISAQLAVIIVALIALVGVTRWAQADGTEQLGSPSIPIAQGSGVVAAGTGLQEQPGVIDLSVPANVTVKQVLLYWSGASPTSADGDNTLVVEGNTVTGTLIGGPTQFYSRRGEGVEFYTYRADITALGLISPGENLLSVEDATFEEENHGAGILVIYDDGTTVSDIELRDGQDLAYKFFSPPLNKVVPQTFTFEPLDVERTVQIVNFVGSVNNDGQRRANIIRITVGDVVTEYLDDLNSSDGAQWDTDATPVIIPPGASSFTIEILSDGEVGEERPASLSWIATAAIIPEVPEDIVGCADFAQWVPGSKVEGYGAVHPNLRITTTNGRATVLAEGVEPVAYWAPNPNADRIRNGGLPEGGFADTAKIHDYEFRFVPGTFRSESGAAGFSLRMVDYGDWNPYGATEHIVELVGFDADGNEIDVDGFFYTTTTAGMPRRGEFNGQPFNPYVQADAVTSQPGEPGNFTLSVFGDDLASAKLRFRNNSAANSTSVSDTLFAITTTCIVSERPPEPTCVNFSRLGPGATVEGLGVLQPNFDISTSGNAVVVLSDASPKAYDAPNDNAARVRNGNIGLLGGISDIERVHDYAFNFTNGMMVNLFSLRMMDFGDWNPNLATEHEVTLVGLDGNGAVVDSDSIAFKTAAARMPRRGEINGAPFNPYLQADAMAAPGQLGNYRFELRGEGIVRVEMRFNNNVVPNTPSDPLFALQEVCYLAP